MKRGPSSQPDATVRDPIVNQLIFIARKGYREYGVSDNATVRKSKTDPTYRAMSGKQQSDTDRSGVFDAEGVDEFELYVKNIGGIEETTVRFSPGVSILSGQNATNRSSLLSAINGVLGGSMATLKSDTDSGRVELRPIVDDDGQSSAGWERIYTRTGSTVSTDGNPVLDVPELIDTYVSLFETNEARQAITTGEGLRDVLLRPVDVGEIQRTIQQKQNERDDIQEDIRQIERRLDREPQLEEERTQLQNDLEALEEEIVELRNTVDEYEADADVVEEAEELVDKLESARDTKRSLEDDLDIHNAKIDALEDEQEEKKQDLHDLYTKRVDTDAVDIPDPGDDDLLDFDVLDHITPEDTVPELEDELDGVRREVRDLSNTITELSRVIEFNENMLNNQDKLASVTAVSESESHPTSKLTDSEKIQCWTCGSIVEKDRIQERNDDLRDVVQEKRNEKRALESRIDDINERLDEHRALKENQKSLKFRLVRIEREKETIRGEIEDVKSELDDAQEEIEKLQTEVNETADLRDSDLLDGYEELSEKEYERGRVESRIEDITEKLEDLDGQREKKDSLESDLESVREEIKELRNRVVNIEEEFANSFNGHMESVLDELGYENIERVWIERKVPSRGSTEFELHVIREGDDGNIYEDTVDTLSESEREVIGLVVAFAGYLVHDLEETAPYILLDSVEMIDAGRLRALIDYMREHTEMLVAALLPEDAATMPEEYTRITAEQIATLSA